MKKVKLLLLTIVASLMMTSCGTTETVPITGRKHRISVSDDQILSLSSQQYSQYMAQAKKSTNAKNTQMVVRVGQKLANAVESYLSSHGYANELKNFSWEFNLVQDLQANAFCMPGGKIVVYEGLLTYTQSEDALAIVLGHQIAHAVAKHSAEQMSKEQNQGILTQIGSAAITMATGDANLGSVAGSVAQSAFSFANLKYSREDELEADHMGLVFAAMAGYNPETAVPFWKRMQVKSTNQSDIFSTHPSDAKRIAALEKLMPEALAYYNATKKTTTTSKKKTTTKKSTTKKKK